jgi:hypothetical protein
VHEMVVALAPAFVATVEGHRYATVVDGSPCCAAMFLIQRSQNSARSA